MIPVRIRLLGSEYSYLKKDEIYAALLADAKAARRGYVCVSNVHTTMTGFFRRAYRRITNSSLYSVPDGLPLVWAMRSLGAHGQDRVRGPSMMRDLFRLGQQQGIRHYLYGGTPEALAGLQAQLRREAPGALVVGAESPPYRPLEAISEAEWAEIALRINSARPHFVWVGLGAPKQEEWMWAQRDRVQGIMFGIGAAFDLLSGRVPEAPAALQACGMEWAYRLWREPRRLWRRYLLNNPLFLLLWAGQLALSLLGRHRAVVQK